MNNPQNVGPTSLGKFVVFLFVVACIVSAGYMFKDTLFPQATANNISLDEYQKQNQVEAMDPNGITTVSEYSYVPSAKLPPVKGVSSYKWSDKEKIVEFPINVWIGWLPIIAANKGFAPNKESVFYKKFGFQVNLKLIDDPVAARDAFVAGESHILWGTLDMMVLFAEQLRRDSRSSLRIFQQIDWSNGGDGVVVRSDIKSVQDLKGKTIVYAQNSPSQYFINNLLLSAGIQPSEVKHKFTTSAFEAAAAFVSDPSIDACVSWAPDIYNIPEKVKGTKILTTTAEANKVIADVWAARADFAKDHPEIIEGLVEGIFHGMQDLKSDDLKEKAFNEMAAGYGMPVDEVKSMEADAHKTNFAENKEFFLNANSPSNFERTWKNITFVYKELGLIGTPIRFDEVMDFSVLKNIDKKGTFKDSKDEYTSTFAPAAYSTINAEKPILTQTIRINYYPNSANVFEPKHDEFERPIPKTLYDPSAEATLEKVALLVGQYDRALIAIVGHTDNSMKGKIPKSAVEELSLDRAKGVKDVLTKKYKFDANKFIVKGMGWDKPAPDNEFNNQALNRRVEIMVYSPENN